MGLSPWAMENLRFDESLGKIHGYDFDFCMQARTAGKKVVTADFQVVHHHSLKLLEDVEGWITAYMQVAEKWDGAAPPQRAAATATGSGARGGPRPRPRRRG